MSLKWYIKQKWQKLTRGYTDEELWNLDTTICKWIIPRLKTFKEKTVGYPYGFNSLEEWKETIQKMIDAFELHNSDLPDNLNMEDFKKEEKSIQEGFELFGKYLNSLWW